MESSDELHVLLRKARLAAGMTQSELAVRARCTQSAVSMFEAGREGALAQGTVARMAKELGVALPDEAAGPSDAKSLFTLKFCPVDECPSNVPYVVRGEICFRPQLVEAPAGRPTRCGHCGEIMLDCCPAESCRAPVAPGSFCACCGTPYVPAARAMRGPVDQWAEGQRMRIRELREMTRVVRLGA